MRDPDSLQSVMGTSANRAASFVYSLTTQILCAKSVPRADAVGVPLLGAGPYGQGPGYAKRTDVQLGKSTLD